MTVLAKIGKDARFLALLLEALKRALKVLVVMDDDFRQNLLPPFVAFAAPAWIVSQLNLASHWQASCCVISSLSGRPVEMPPPEDMNVQVRNGLAAILASVDHSSKSPIGDSLLLRNPSRETQH